MDEDVRKYKLSKEESETTINFNDLDKIARIYTCNKALIRKLDNFCLSNPVFTLIKKDKYAGWYECPKKCIKIHKPRVQTEENSNVRAERMKRIMSKGE